MNFPAQFNLSDLDGSNGFALNGIDAGDRSGFSVSSAGDINGDGLDDLIIGAYYADPNGSQSGASYVVFGSDAPFSAAVELSSLDGSNGFVLNGITESDLSGRSVSGVGDINGDGLDDLIISALAADPNGSQSGASYVVFGSDAPFSAAVELS
ncbi:MAG: integrin alpha, partial [Cyanobacteria bacterium J06629_19]